MRLTTIIAAVALTSGTAHGETHLLTCWEQTDNLAATGCCPVPGCAIGSATGAYIWIGDSVDLWLGDGVFYPESDEPMTVEFTSANEPQFDAFVANLTSGVNDSLCRWRMLEGWPVAPGGPTCFPETVIFPDVDIVDLAGAVIDSITITIDDLDITPQSGCMAQWNFCMTVEFYGEWIQPADVTKDGNVNVEDVVGVIQAWGSCDPESCFCLEDVDRNGSVGVADLVEVILNWGG